MGVRLLEGRMGGRIFGEEKRGEERIIRLMFVCLFVCLFE